MRILTAAWLIGVFLLGISSTAATASDDSLALGLTPRQFCPSPEGCDCGPVGCKGKYELASSDTTELDARIAAAEASCASSGKECGWLARRYEKGEGVTKDLAKAASLMVAGCAKFDRIACALALDLADHLMDGAPSPESDPNAAITLRQDLCDLKTENAAPACVDLGRIFDEGSLVPRDSERSTELFRRACNRNSHEGCAQFALAVMRSDAPVRPGATMTPDTSDRWRDLGHLSALCGGLKEACRVLGERHLRGFRTPVDLAEAARAFDRACALGDSDSCEVSQTIPRPTHDGVTFDEPGVRDHACKAGDPESCWHQGLLSCRGLVTAPDERDLRGNQQWVNCANARRRCDLGSWRGCLDVADYYTASMRTSEAETVHERAGKALDAACDHGDPQACAMVAARSGSCARSFCFGKVDSAAFHARADDLAGAQCDSGDGESCVWLAMKLKWHGVISDPPRFKRLLEKAAEFDRGPCERGDDDVCFRLRDTYFELNDPRRHALEKARCRAGSSRYCEFAQDTEEHAHNTRTFGAMASTTGGWDSALGWGAGLTTVIGKHTVKAGSSEGWHGAEHSVKGLLLQTDAGQRGWKLSAGWALFDRPPDGLVPSMVQIGLVLKATYLQEWEDGPRKGKNSLGGEAEIDLLGLRLALGYLKAKDTSGRFTFGVGARF
jgi:TPR repeat protein